MQYSIVPSTQEMLFMHMLNAGGYSKSQLHRNLPRVAFLQIKLQPWDSTVVFLVG